MNADDFLRRDAPLERDALDLVIACSFVIELLQPGADFRQRRVGDDELLADDADRTVGCC